MRHAKFIATITEGDLDRLRRGRKASGFVSAGLVLAMVSAFHGVSLNPSQLNFGSMQVGGGSALQKVTLANHGNGDLRPSRLEISGAASADFHVRENPCSSVRSGESCTLLVEFQPQEPGSRQARLVIETPEGNKLGAELSGSATMVSPAALAFDGITPGAQAIQNVELKGGEELQVRDVSFSPAGGQFQVEAGGCRNESDSVKACRFAVHFVPRAEGTWQAALLLTENGGGTHRVAVSGTSSLPGNALGHSTQPKDIAHVDVPAPTPAATPDVTPLPVAAATPTPAVAAPTATPSYVARVTPTPLPPQIYNPPPPPPRLNAAIRVEPGVLDFTSREQQAQAVYVVNPGNAPLRVAVRMGGPNPDRFQADAGSCAAPVLPGRSCVIGVRYVPGADALSRPGYGAQLLIAHNAEDAPLQTVALRWVQTVSQRPHLRIDPAVLDFSSFYTSSLTKMSYHRPQLSFTVVNDGPVALRQLNLRSVAGGSVFNHTNNCRQLEPGQRCTEIVAFTPMQQTSYRDRLYVAEGNLNLGVVELAAMVPSRPPPNNPPAGAGNSPQSGVNPGAIYKDRYRTRVPTMPQADPAPTQTNGPSRSGAVTRIGPSSRYGAMQRAQPTPTPYHPVLR